MGKRNFFNTLNEALDSESLVELWPLGSNIQYGETTRHIVQSEPGVVLLISVYRNEVGQYERPIYYRTN